MFHRGDAAGTASRFYDISGYEWKDGAWFDYKRKKPHYNQPVNIYEMHAGSWRSMRTAPCSPKEKLGDELIPLCERYGLLRTLS